MQLFKMSTLGKKILALFFPPHTSRSNIELDGRDPKHQAEQELWVWNPLWSGKPLILNKWLFGWYWLCTGVCVYVYTHTYICMSLSKILFLFIRVWVFFKYCFHFSPSFSKENPTGEVLVYPYQKRGKISVGRHIFCLCSCHEHLTYFSLLNPELL